MIDKKQGYSNKAGSIWTQGHQKLWRTHGDAVNMNLLKRWLPLNQAGCLLKTDLFDEAVGDGLYPYWAPRKTNLFFIDTSCWVHKMARKRYTILQTVGADIRYLPFHDCTFEVIVSNSTLDHFESFDEIIISLYELHRILQKGGQLILTLDNLANPIVALRNALPFSLLNRMGIVPYFVGTACGPTVLQRALKRVGFEVLEIGAVMHCPRVLAVAVAQIFERFAKPKTQKRFLRILMAFEQFSHWPTRFLTGYYIAANAIKH